MLELHVASIDDLDTAWRLLRSQDAVTEALLCVAGQGPLWAARCVAGRWTAHYAGPQGSGCPPAGLAACQS